MPVLLQPVLLQPEGAESIEEELEPACACATAKHYTVALPWLLQHECRLFILTQPSASWGVINTTNKSNNSQSVL